MLRATIFLASALSLWSLKLHSMMSQDDPDMTEQSEDDESNDDCTPELCASSASSYKRLIAIRAGKPKGSLKEALKVETDRVGRLSLSEQALEKATGSHGTDVVRYYHVSKQLRFAILSEVRQLFAFLKILRSSDCNALNFV